MNSRNRTPAGTSHAGHDGSAEGHDRMDPRHETRTSHEAQAGRVAPAGRGGGDGHAGHTDAAAYANHDDPARRDPHGDDHHDRAPHDDRAPHSNHDPHAPRGAHGDDHRTHGVPHDSHGDDHDSHAGHGGDHAAMFRRLFWANLVLAVPVVSLSPAFASLLGYSIPESGVVAWIPPILGTVLYLWGGRPFLSGAASELRSRSPGMMTLISLAITVAFVASWGATVGVLDASLEFWWELGLLVVIMLLGHWIEMRSLARTSSALDSLAALLPDEAERVEDGETVTVAVADLRVGDLVVVRPGGSVPADGRIVDGRAAMDESMVTGESRAVPRGVDEHVTAGTVATDSGLRVEVTAVGDDTTLAGIQQLVEQAQGSSSRAQRLADTAAGWLFWLALGSAVLTAAVWSALGMPDSAVTRTVTVLVIACPHALGLAIPLVVAIATERAARGGVLVKDRLALEGMRTVTTVLFDKTGTLTKGEPTVTGVVAVEPFDDDTVLALAAAAETDSEHPLARAIVGAAADRGLDVPASSGFSSAPAVGVTARVDDHEVHVGGPRLLEEHGLDAAAGADAWRGEGASVLHVVRDDAVVGALRIADEVRPESAEAVRALHRLGIEVAMITGDAQSVADSVADELGIDRVFAHVRPQDKADKVAELQGEGKVVAMVGDGVNDAPALARADVGIAIGAGTDVAIASAGVILASDDPRSVLSVIELSGRTYRKMKQNLWWAAGYNLLAVPLAAGVLAPIGFVIPMSVGAILMSASTVVVAANAQLLRRLDLRAERSAQAVLA